jgi:hypothetical protein
MLSSSTFFMTIIIYRLALMFPGIGMALSHDNRYEPEINPDFAEFAEYYGTVIIPARVAEARDKDHASDCTSLRLFAVSFV